MNQEKTVTLPSSRSSSISNHIIRILEDCTHAWRLTQNTVLAIWVTPAVIAFFGLIAALLGKSFYKWLTHEDGMVENLQVLFYAVALGMGILVVRRLWQAGNKGMAFLYLGLCLGFVLLIGEEISWGQRLFGWQTDAALKAINRQGETNLHNLHGLEGLFRGGQLLIGVYGTLMPLALLLPNFPTHYRKITNLVVPHYSLIPYFFFLLSWRVIHNVFSLTQSHPYAADEYTEFIELILSIGCCLFMLFRTRQFSSEESKVP